MGGLVSQYVSLKTAIEIPMGADKVFSLQADFFDALVPGLLPLLLTLGCYALLKKGIKAQYVILILIGVAIVGGLVGVL